jgi:hypothetical protein
MTTTGNAVKKAAARKRNRRAKAKATNKHGSLYRKPKRRARTLNRVSLVRSISAPLAGKHDAELFRIALRDPFSPGAIGCRVPDAHPLPTATYHIRASLPATTNSSGNIRFMILPSPVFTIIQGLNLGGCNGYVAFSQNGGAGYLVSPETLSAVLTEYRVVSWGLRILAKDTAFNMKGKLFVALVPTTGNAPSWNTLNTVSATTISIVSEYTAGIDITNNSCSQLPGAMCYSAQDLLRSNIQVLGLPTGSEYYNFKGTGDRLSLQWASGQVLADEGVFSTTGLVNATAGGRKDVASLRGGLAVIIEGTGFVASSNEFDVELIYHLEGVPNMGASANALVPSSTRPVLGSLGLVEKTISAVRTIAPVIGQLATTLSPAMQSPFAKGAMAGATRALLM